MNDKNVIGWRRNYSSSFVPVTNYVMRLGDSVGNDERVTLFLEKLFGLGVRGLDLYEIAYCRKGEHANYLIDLGKPVLFVYPPVESVEDTHSEWYRRNRRVISQLNIKYPGLFVVEGGGVDISSLDSLFFLLVLLVLVMIILILLIFMVERGRVGNVVRRFQRLVRGL
jgi:hypothetical protein